MYCRIFSKVQQWGNKSLPGLPADNSYLSFIEFLFVHFLLKFLFGACIVSEIDLFQSKCATQWATNHWWNCCWHLRARKDNQGLQNGQQDQNTFSAVFFPGTRHACVCPFCTLVFLQSYTIFSLAIFLLHDESTLGSRRLPFYTKVDYKFSFLK